MPVNFPANLDGHILAGTWSEQRRVHYREFETDSGRVMRSKMPGTPETDFRGEFNLTASEVTDLESFYAVDCAEGVNDFWMEHPMKGGLEVFRWAAPPEFSHVAGNIYRVTLSLVRE